MSPILVTLTSRSESDFETSNIGLEENKPDVVNLNSNNMAHYVRKNEGKILWFLAGCTVSNGQHNVTLEIKKYFHDEHRYCRSQ